VIDLSHLPDLVSGKHLRSLGLSETDVAHVKKACGRVQRVPGGRHVYVLRDDLARVLAESEVKVT
jgi:hypothetical protein